MSYVLFSQVTRFRNITMPRHCFLHPSIVKPTTPATNRCSPGFVAVHSSSSTCTCMYCMYVCSIESVHMHVSMSMQRGWGHIQWPAPLLFWFIRPVESIITESLHLLAFITPHLFSFYSQGLAEYITDFPWGRGAGSSAIGGRQWDDGEGLYIFFKACFIIRGISIIFRLQKH